MTITAPHPPNLEELRIEGKVAADKGLRIGWYCIEAADEIQRLRGELAEVDAMVAARRDSLDDRPRNEWPSNSIMEKAISRHESRVTQQSAPEPETPEAKHQWPGPGEAW